MKNLLILILTLVALQGSAQRFLLKEGETFTYKSYPRKDFAPLVGLSESLQWYVEVQGVKPVYDGRTHYLSVNKTATDQASVYGDHIKVYTVVYSAQLLDDDLIVANIHMEAENYLENNCPASEQANYRTEGLLLLEKSILGTATEADEARKTYLKQIQIWFVTVRAEASVMANAYLNEGTLPSFSFTSKPTEP